MKFEVFRSAAGGKRWSILCANKISQQVLSSLGLPKVSGMPKN